MTRIVKVHKFPVGVESIGVRDVNFSDYGNVAYPKGWAKAFEQAGFDRITREELEEIVGEVDPDRLVQDNTYNKSSNIWKDIQFGINELPDGSGRALLVFRPHSGSGDVRTGYGNARYLIYEDGKDAAISPFHEVAYPEIYFDIYEVDSEGGQGERLVSCRLMAGGAVEFQEDQLDLVQDDIWAMAFGHDKSGHTDFKWDIDNEKAV